MSRHNILLLTIFINLLSVAVSSTAIYIVMGNCKEINKSQERLKEINKRYDKL